MLLEEWHVANFDNHRVLLGRIFAVPDCPYENEMDYSSDEGDFNRD